MEALITSRLVEMTFASLEEAAAWLTRLGMEVQLKTEGVVTVRNPHLNITTALMTGSDPITRAVCLGFALMGAHWVSLCPCLLDEVNKEWRARRRATTPCREDRP